MFAINSGDGAEFRLVRYPAGVMMSDEMLFQRKCREIGR